MIELIVVVVLIILICLLIGVEATSVILGICGLLLLFVALMAAGFICFTVRIALSKKSSAEFVRIEKAEGAKFSAAIYRLEEGEFPCAFPAEIIMREMWYEKEKPCTVFFDGKKKRVFDRNAVITCIVGGASCTALTVSVVMILVSIML